MIYLYVSIESILQNTGHCKVLLVPFVSWNVPTTILVRPLAIVEHSVVSVTSIKHGFKMVINWYFSPGHFTGGPCEGICQGELLPHSFIAVPHVKNEAWGYF